MDSLQILKKYFGYDNFRGGQEELITSILKKKDTLGIMPTGAGKSICFQLPAMMMDGMTIVISPLVSLMKDQVEALTQSGVAAAFINSSLTPLQISKTLDNAKNSKYKLLYVAPERLFASDFLAFCQSHTISMVTIDEAHCISQWGQDFRPSYTQIPQFIRLLSKRPVISAFTATATEQVQNDIIELLQLQEPTLLVAGFDRENLYFEVQKPRSKLVSLFTFLETRKNKSGIVYCSTRKNVEEVCRVLCLKGFSASRYHAGLSDAERRKNQDDFLYDTVQIMVATNAFGMGIDKSNVSFVVHYNMPQNIESYYQEAGRAGRDGSPAECLLLYSPQDVRTNQWMIENSKDRNYPDVETEQLLKERDYARLREMTFYSTTNRCLREYILRYFGESPPNFCGYCSNCNTKFETVDITIDAQKILSCVHRMEERFGATLVIEVLRGSKNERIKQLGFDTLSTFGISEKSPQTLRIIIDYLVQTGYLKQSEGKYPVLGLTANSGEVLFKKKELEMKMPIETENTALVLQKDTLPPERKTIFERLKELCKTIAQEQHVPSYNILNNKSLTELALRLPQTEAEFLTVPGIGEVKLKKYGAVFMNEITQYCNETNATPILPYKQASKKKKKDTGPLVLPDEAILSAIHPSGQPIPVSGIVAIINIPLNNNACSIVSVQKVSNWLVAQNILEVDEESSAKSKIPTQTGIELGISQQERITEHNRYTVNLYTSKAQQFIIDHIPDILSFSQPSDKETSAEEE